MKCLNSIKVEFESRSVNESLARMVVGAFVSQLDPTVEEISDIKTAVSEAVTNCVVHAYRDKIGKIYIKCELFEDKSVRIKIKDNGCGIEDINKAMQPLYTTKQEEERSGLGFSVMECMVDKIRVSSTYGKSTTVTLIKKIASKE